MDDFDGNGRFGPMAEFGVGTSGPDPGEHIIITRGIIAGQSSFTFPIPDDAALGTTFARFRFSTSQLFGRWYGLAEDGEVEDYEVTILAAPNSATPPPCVPIMDPADPCYQLLFGP